MSSQNKNYDVSVALSSRTCAVATTGASDNWARFMQGRLAGWSGGTVGDGREHWRLHAWVFSVRRRRAFGSVLLFRLAV